MDTFPRADIHATFTKYTLALIYMNKLFRFNRLMEIIVVDLYQSITIRERHHRRVCVSACHISILCPAHAILACGLYLSNSSMYALNIQYVTIYSMSKVKHSSTSRFVFAVDLDGVCANYTESLRPFMAAKGNMRAFELEAPKLFNLADAGWFTNMAEYNAVHGYAVEHSLFRSMQEIVGMSDGRWELSDNEVHIRVVTHRILTHGDQDRAVVDTIAWLQQKRPDGRVRVPYRDLCFLAAKADMTADIHIDDAPHQIEKLVNAGENVLIYDQPYNRHIDAARAVGWAQVVEKVMNAQRIWLETKN